MMELKYKRVLIKLSGEALSKENEQGINFESVKKICKAVKECYESGCKIAIVIGGGNFWRGKLNPQMDRITADHIGMLATTMNSLALHDTFTQLGIESIVQTGIEMSQIAEFYIRNRAVKHLEKNRIVIFGCGTGNPFFSTDTAAALRAAEIEADVILLAKNVDGVYDKDPNKFADAKKYDKLTYMEVIEQGLQVMDSTATTLCMDNNIPILVFGISDEGNIKKAIKGEKIGTIVSK
ncbi:MAG: UMP kinase [Bacilli bacterium]